MTLKEQSTAVVLLRKFYDRARKLPRALLEPEDVQLLDDADRFLNHDGMAVAWYRGDDLCCWTCGTFNGKAGQLDACPSCGATEKPVDQESHGQRRG